MGFGKNGAFWKKKLAEWAPDAWYFLKDAPREGIDVVIEDIMLKRFRTADSKQELEKIWTNYAGDVFKDFPDATKIVALFDEDRSMVSKAKWPEQKNRTAKYRGLEEADFKALGDAVYLCHQSSSSSSDERVFDRVFGPQELGPPTTADKEAKTGFRAFLSCYHNTPRLRKDSMAFLTRCICAPSPESAEHFGPGKTVWIDRGIVDGDTQRKGLIVKHDGTVSFFSGRDHIPAESDLKLGAYLRRHKGEGVWIRCADMDVIPIVLLAMEDLIDRDTGNVEGKVFVDLTPLSQYTSSAPKREVVDMVALWKAVFRKMRDTFSIQTHPVYTLCAFMILCGTDFVKKPSLIAMGTLWPAFANGGHMLLSNCIRTDLTVGEADWNGGDRWLSVDEGAIINFYRYAYTYKKDKKSLTLSSVPLLFGTPGEARRDLQQKSFSFADISTRYAPRKRKKPDKAAAARAPPPLPLHEQSARAEARRLAWNVFYWYGGHAMPPPDAVQMHPENGSAMYGWKQDPDSGEVVATESVCSSEELRNLPTHGKPPAHPRRPRKKKARFTHSSHE